LTLLIHVLGDVTTPIKQIYQQKALAVRDTAALADKLAVDPETSFVDCVIMPSNLLNGIGGKVLKQAFHTKHPKVAIIVFYKNIDDRDSFADIEDLKNVFIHQYQKINDLPFFQECIEKDLEKAILAGDIDLPQSMQEIISPIGGSVDIFKDAVTPVKIELADGKEAPMWARGVTSAPEIPVANSSVQVDAPVQNNELEVKESFHPEVQEGPFTSTVVQQNLPGESFEPDINGMDPPVDAFASDSAVSPFAKSATGFSKPEAPQPTMKTEPVKREVPTFSAATGFSRPAKNEPYVPQTPSFAQAPAETPAPRYQYIAQPEPEPMKVQKTRYEFEPGGIIDPEKAAITTVNTWEDAANPMTSPMGYVPAPPRSDTWGRPDQSLKERLEKAAENLDVESIDQLLKNGNVARELMSENADYMGAQTAISILDRQINAIYTDPKITNAQERMQKIISLCSQRSSHKAVSNSIFANKCQELITAVSQSALDCVDEIRTEYQQKYTMLDVANMFYQNREKLEQIATDRFDGQLNLSNTLNRLRRLYLVLDRAKDEAINDLSTTEIARNSLVSTSLKPMTEMFSPENTTELVQAILVAMGNNRVTFAQAETDLTDLFDSLFKVADLSDAFAVQSARQMQLLEANRVEDLVICENTIKYKIHSMIGPDNVGRTATAVCVATALSRTDNVLLIDLSSDSRINRYVRTTTSLTDFYEAQTKDKLKIVKRTEDCIFNEYKFEEALKGACPHYRYIYVLMSMDNMEEYSFLKRISLSVNFITNATIDKIEETKKLTSTFDEDNTARLVTLINCETDPLDVLEALGVDQLMTRLIRIPFFKEIQASTLRRSNPCDSQLVADYFLEAFA
jgi:hypothetical protein